MGGKTPKETTTKQTSEAPSYLQPHLVNLFNDANRATDSVPTDPYTGDLVAGPNSTQTDALSGILNVANSAQGMGSNTTAAANQLAQSILGGKYEAPTLADYDPTAAMGFVDTAVRPVVQQYQENLIPQLTSAAIDQGAYGGSRSQLQQSNMLRDFNNTIADTTQRVIMDDYKTTANLMPAAWEAEQRAATLLPSLTQQGYNLDLQPYTTAATVGDQLNVFDQRELDADLAEYNNSITAPFQGLNQLAAILGTGTGYGTTTATSTSTGGGGGGAMGALTGGAGAGGIAYALGASNPLTAGAVGLGALLGLFG